MKTLYITVGKTVAKQGDKAEVFTIPFRQYTCLIVVAMPRYGKGGVAKPLSVKLHHERPVCFFDFKGEWSRHVTHPNYESRAQDCINNYEVYSNFTFNIKDFNLVEDWVSMGYTSSNATDICNLFNDTIKHHHGIPELFMEVLKELPSNNKEFQEYNPHDLGVDLNTSVHPEVKRSWIRIFDRAKRWFWQGTDDKRKVFDFGKEWLEHRNIFIDFSINNSLDADTIHRHRTFFGKIMQKMQPYFTRIQGVIIIEEADVLIPNVGNDLKPSSNRQMVYCSAKAPKQGISMILIMQNPKQTDQEIFMGGQWAYILGQYADYPKKFPRLKYFPESNYREFLFVDVNTRWKIFTPEVPCCEYESNIKGGESI